MLVLGSPLYSQVSYVVLGWLALAGECTTEEGP